MVEFLKARPTSFVNKPIGIISTNTGGVELGNAIAQAGANATEMFFREAVDEQTKLGKKTATELKIKVRDDDGNLQFQELPATLSDVARETATPILQKRYAETLYVDTSNRLKQMAIDAENYSEFESMANDYLTATENEMSKSGIGESLIGMYRTDSSKLRSQYGMKKYADDVEKEEKIAVENELFIIQDYMNDAFMLEKNGLTDSSQMNIDLVNQGLAQLQGRVSRTTITDIQNKIKVGITSSKVMRGMDGFNSIQMNTVEKAFREGNFNVIPKPLQEELAKKGVTRDILRGLTDANVNSIVTRISGNASNQASLENAMKDVSKNKSMMTEIASGTASNTSKYREALDTAFVGYDSAYAWASNPDILKDQNALMMLQKTNILPNHLFNMLGNVKNNSQLTSQQIFNLNLIRRQAMSSTTRDGSVRSLSKGLDTDTVNFWTTYDHLIRSMGAEEKDQAYRIALKTYQTDDDRLVTGSAIQQRFGSDQSPNSIVDRELRKIASDNGWSLHSLPLMKRLAVASFSNNEISTEQITDTLNQVYETMYTKSDIMYNPTFDGVVKASNFAPERYISSDKIDEWKEGVNAKLKLAGKNLELGKNAFLMANPNSDASTARYIAVGADGVALQDGNGNLIQSATTQDMRTVMKRRKALDNHLQNLFKKQTLKENASVIGSGGITGGGKQDVEIQNQLKKLKNLSQGKQ